MASKQLIEYVRENIENGHKLEDIRSFLRTYGWNERDIDEAILAVSGSAGAVPKPPKPAEGEPAKKKGHKKLIIALIILIILVVFFLNTAFGIVSYFTDMFPTTLLPFNLSISR